MCTVAVGDRVVAVVFGSGQFYCGSLEFGSEPGVFGVEAVKFFGQFLTASSVQLVAEVSLEASAETVAFGAEIADLAACVSEFCP